MSAGPSILRAVGHARPSAKHFFTSRPMTYRWAVMVTFAVLSSPGLPAAWAQSDRTVADAPPGATTTTRRPSSPVDRFAAVAASAQTDLPPAPKRTRKRSVLEPSTSRWLEDEAADPSGTAQSPQSSMPDSLSPLTRGPGPESIPDELAVPGGPSAGLDPGDFGPSVPRHLFDRLPRLGPARQPMLRESWLFRPFNISVFEGALFATSPVRSEFHNGVGFFTGFRVGWDFDAHFGGETRFGFSKIYLLDSTRTTEVGYQKLFYFDSNLLIYPWGDTRWRPFLSVGGGLADVLIVSNSGGTLHPDAFNLPFGGGIKYRYGSRVAFRADIRDNLTISGGGGLRTLNNLELLGSIEFHFGGGDRRSYWPWNPSRHWW
jgi:hypothetical protein